MRTFFLGLTLSGLFALPTRARPDADTDEVKAELTKQMNGLRFSSEIDDTRDVRDGITKTIIGKGGVMKYLSGGQLSVDEMTVTRDGAGRKAVYMIVMKAKLSAGYHELHYKGIGGLADKKNEGGLTADVTFKIEDRRGEAKILATKLSAQRGFGDGVNIMVESAKTHIVKKLKD